MTNPFATPAKPSGFDVAEHLGALVVIDVDMFETGIDTKFGPTDAIRAKTIDVLDGAHAGETYDDALIFGRALVGALRPNVGRKVLGRIGQGVASAGKSAPWLLNEADEADTAAGVAWLNRSALAKPGEASGRRLTTQRASEISPLPAAAGAPPF